MVPFFNFFDAIKIKVSACEMCILHVTNYVKLNAISLSRCTACEIFQLIIVDLKILRMRRSDNNTGERNEWDTGQRFD